MTESCESELNPPDTESCESQLNPPDLEGG